MKNTVIRKDDVLTPLMSSLRSCRVMIKYVLVFGLMVNLLMLASPLYSMQVLDRVLSSGNIDTLIYLTLVIVLALSLLSTIQAARSNAMTKLATWVEDSLSEKVFKNSIRLALESKAMANSQQMRDLQTIKTFITSPGILVMMDIPWALIFLIVLFILHPYIGFLVLGSGIILVILGVIGERATKPLIEKNNDNFIQSMREVDQATRNAEVISVMGFSVNVIKSWKVINDQVQNTQSLTVKRQLLFGEVTKFFRMLMQISVTGLGAYLVLKGEFSSGAIIASSSIASRALAPFEIALNFTKQYANTKKSYIRLSDSFTRYQSEDEKMPLPDPQGEIDVENLYYAPPGSQSYIIKGVNLSLKAGETLVVLGQSASGKTTLVKLLLGVYQPVNGSVRIDGASLKDWNRDLLGPHIGYLPQDIELLSGTVRENIGRMDSEADPEKVVEAAQLAGVHDLILHLPQGYNTKIGVDGSNLSGGQKQRIALARALYNNPKIVVLDEPNASLDAEGEAALTTAIKIAKERGVTIIIITHRPAAVELADKILVMQQGMAAAFGPRDEILAKMGGGPR